METFSNHHHFEDDEQFIDVSIHAKSRHLTAAGLRESLSPLTNPSSSAKRLFNPSPSRSTSPLPVQARAHLSTKSSGNRSLSDDFSRAVESHREPQLSSQAESRLSPAPSHVSEVLRSPSPPRKRPRDVDHHRERRDTIQEVYDDSRHVPKFPMQPSKKQRRSSPIDPTCDSANLEQELFQDDHQIVVNDERSPRQSEGTSRLRGSEGPVKTAAHRPTRRKVQSLQGLVDWTWPAVQKALKDFR